MIKNKYKFSKVFVIFFPLIKGTVKRVLNGLQAVCVSNGEILPECSERFVACFFFNVLSGNYHF